MDIEKLNRLTRIDFIGFLPSENNVKYKIVIPFLQAFNHTDLDLEHAAQGSRIDINIGNRIIVETKALGINLDNCVQQLSNYSGRELPILAILTNGKQFRIYSPQWRQLRSFSEKLIYEFELKDLNNIDLVNRLEKILGFSNYKSEEFIEHIEQREREILKAKIEIEQIKKMQTEQLAELNKDIIELKEKRQQIDDQIRAKDKIVATVNANRIPEIEDKIKVHFLPIKKNQTQTIDSATSKAQNTYQRTIVPIQGSDLQQASNPVRTEEAEIVRVEKKVPKWFNSPHQANHKILVAYLNLLGDGESVPLTELQRACSGFENFGTHYLVMKVITERNHGKVFEEKNKQVFLWAPVKEFIKAEYEKFQTQR
jgi:DNA-binding transcriptional MerR regulator